MSEKPILFSTSMVRAILDGRKTMTRRVIKPQPDEKHSYCHGICTSSTDNKNVGRIGFGPSSVLVKQFINPPYQPGDRLWVRETWAGLPQFHNLNSEIERYIYKADEDATPLKWKPSIHMPKEAARIWLEVVNVRVERLQEIAEEDVKAEGVYPGFQIAGPNSTPATTAKQAFMWLWQSLNDKRGFSWAHNPWVWVISFERRTV